MSLPPSCRPPFPGCMTVDQFFDMYDGACSMDANDDMRGVREKYGFEAFTLGNIVQLPDMIDDFPKNWNYDLSLSGHPVDPECFDYNVNQTGELPGYIALLTVYFMFYVVFTGLYIMRRTKQPIRARSFWPNIGLSLTASVYLALLVVNQSAGTTGPCIINLITRILFPLLLFHYWIRCSHLIFIYRWSLSKLDSAKMSWYSQRKWVLEPRTYFIIMSVILSFIAAVVIGMTQSYPEVYSGSTSELSSARCEWWTISPDSIQNATARLAAMGEPFYHDVSMLTHHPFMTIPFGNHTYAPAAASPINASDPLGGGFYAADLESCVGCSFLHPVFLYATLGLAYLFILLLVLSAIIIRKLNDELGLWNELVAWLVVAIPLCVVQMVGMQDHSVWSWGEQAAHPDYISTVILCIWSFVCSILYPTVSSFPAIRKYSKQLLAGSIRHLRKGHVGDGMDIELTSGVSSGPSNAAAAAKNGGAPGAGNAPTLDFVLSNDAALELYREFAVKEFTVENIQFLIAVYNLRFSKNREPDAKKIYQTFLADSAPMALNVSADNARFVRKIFEGPQDVPIPPDSFNRVDQEIRTLIEKDSWPRFMRTSAYKKLQQLFSDTSSMEYFMVDTLNLSVSRTQASIADAAVRLDVEKSSSFSARGDPMRASAPVSSQSQDNGGSISKGFFSAGMDMLRRSQGAAMNTVSSGAGGNSRGVSQDKSRASIPDIPEIPELPDPVAVAVANTRSSKAKLNDNDNQV